MRFSDSAAVASSVILAIIAGLGELNVGSDFNLAQVIWFVFVISAGGTLAVPRELGVTSSIQWPQFAIRAIPCSATLGFTMAISCILYGACNGSAIEVYGEGKIDWAGIRRLVLVVAITPIAIAASAIAWPMISYAATWWLGQDTSKIKSWRVRITLLGTLVAAIYLTLRTITLSTTI